MFREHEGTVQITPYGSGFGPSDELADPGSFSRLLYRIAPGKFSD
jgi:hypothetical protein